jgi:hypothetical protein
MRLRELAVLALCVCGCSSGADPGARQEQVKADFAAALARQSPSWVGPQWDPRWGADDIKHGVHLLKVTHLARDQGGRDYQFNVRRSRGLSTLAASGYDPLGLGGVRATLVFDGDRLKDFRWEPTTPDPTPQEKALLERLSAELLRAAAEADRPQ